MARVVILGAGYGGAYTFDKLHKRFHNNSEVKLTIVNKYNYFMSTPLLHEVATGSIAPEHIVEPLRELLGCSEDQFVMSEVEEVRLKDKKIVTKHGELRYDYLVVALGSQTNFRGVTGARENTIELKSLEDAIKIKNHLISMFEQAAESTDSTEVKRLLHFVVVGGGATGVELSAEMADLFECTFKKFYGSELMRNVMITIIHAGDELLFNFSRSIRVKTKRALRGKGINVRFGLAVTEVTKESVTMNNGERIDTRTVIWVAGAIPVQIKFDTEIAREQGRITVNQYLQIPHYPEVFVLGDMAAFRNPDETAILPMLAQVAHKQSVAVANNVSRMIEGREPVVFVYKHWGDLVSLGQWLAAGDLFGVKFFGHLTWLLWRGVYLSKLLSIGKRLQVAFDWLLNIFRPRDISEI